MSSKNGQYYKRNKQQQQQIKCSTINSSSSFLRWISVAIVVLLLLYIISPPLLVWISNHQTKPISTTTSLTTTATATTNQTISTTTSTNYSKIKLRSISNNKKNHHYNVNNNNNIDDYRVEKINSGILQQILYYQCHSHKHTVIMPTASGQQKSDSSSTTRVNNVNVQVVLLHGAAFTKEDWKTSGILHQFCTVPTEILQQFVNNNVYNNNTIDKTIMVELTITFTITALDLDVKAPYDKLRTILQQLRTSTDQSSSYIALVTPSASGSIVIDWLLNDFDDLQKFVHCWIPVASYAALTLSDKLDMQMIYPNNDNNNNSTNHNLPILAIYGDQDSKGEQASNILQSKLYATVQKLIGRHPVYLDSPTEFVTTIQKYIIQQLSITT